MKGVKNYLKNVGKSTIYMTSDIVKQDLMPNVSEFAETNLDFLRNTYQVIKNPKAATKRVIDSISESKVFKAVDYGTRNLFEDLRTGNYYNKEREDRDAAKLSGLGGDDWGDLSDFDIDDDWESKMDSDSGESATVGEMQIVDSIEKSNAALANTTSATIAAAAEVGVKNARMNTGILYEQNERLFGGIHNDLNVLGATMDTILKISSEVLPNIDKNMSSYFTDSIKMQKENNAAIKEMLEMQRNMYKSALEREEDEARNKKKYGNRYSDITSGGIPNLSEYLGGVKNNISKKIAESIGISDFSEDGNILAAMLTSPVKSIMKPLIEKVIPDAVKQASKELDNTASGIFGQIMGRLTNATSDIDNDFLSSILGLFGVKTGVNKNIDTSKYHKGPVPFDGITRKAIIDVIPAYLRRIEAALTGNTESMYDYNSGRWVKAKDVKKQFDEIRKNSINSATSDIRGAMSEGIKIARISTAVEERESLDKAWDEFYAFLYERNGIFDPKKSADANKIDRSRYPELIKEHNYKKICQVYSDFDYDNSKKRNMNLSTRMNIANKVLSAKDAEERQYRSMEDGLNIFSQYFSSPDKFDMHGEFKGKNKDKFTVNNDRLIKVVDNKGNNIFDYLQKISAELEWQRLNGFSKSKKRGRGKGNTNSSSDFGDIFNSIGNLKGVPTTDVAKEQSDRETQIKKALQLIANGEAADFTLLDDENDVEYYDQLSYYLRKQATEAERKRFKAEVEGGGAISVFINGSDKISKIDKKDKEKATKEINKLIKDNFDESKDDKDEDKKESVIETIFGKAKKARDFLSGIVQAPGEIFSDLLYSADKAIYDMFFKKELKDEGEEGTEEYKGFLEFITGKAKNTFEKLTDNLNEKIIDPLREKLGIGEDFESRVKDSVKNIAYGLGGRIIDFNKEIYTPAYETLLDKTGMRKHDPRVAKRRSDLKSRNKIVSNIRKANNMDFMQLQSFAEELGINMSEGFENADDAHKTVRMYLGKKLYEQSKDLTEISDPNEYNLIVEYLCEFGTDQELLKLVGDKGGTLTGNTKQERNNSLRQWSKTYWNDTINPVIANRKNKIIDQLINNSILRSGNITIDELNAMTESQLLDLANERGIGINLNAKGTISSIPFRGNTMLSKGEMLFNNNGVGVVGKTGAYHLDDPTHILSSYDSHPILKSMGINMGSRKTPAQDLISENNMKNKLFGKVSDITNHAGGTTAKVSNGIDYDLIRSNLKEYAPEGVAGGIVGGIVSTLFGVVGGPLVGAAVGAAGNIIANSDSLKDKLFGPLGDDGKRNGGGLISKNVMKTINKYLPDMAKYGAAGIIPGLISPLGPLGGVLIGGAIGMLKNNEAFTNKYFGEEGKLSVDDKTKKIIEDMIPGAAKGAAAGVVATLFGGPFGFLGNAAIGSAIGMALSTEEFKEGILGKEINGIRNGGLLGTVKEAFGPLLDIGDTLKNKLIRAFDQGIVEPISKFITPAIHELPHLLSWGPRQLNKIMEKIFYEDNFLGHTISGLINNPLTRGIGGITGKVVDAAGAISPIKLLGVAGDKIRNNQIKNYRADYMTAAEREATGKGTQFDKTLSLIGTKDGLSLDKVKRDKADLLAISNSSREIDAALKKQQKEITARIDTFTVRDGATFSKGIKDKLKDRIKKNDIEGFSRLLDQAILSDGRGLSQEERRLFMEGSKDGASSFRSNFANLQTLTEAKKMAGSIHGRSERKSKLKETAAYLAKTYGVDPSKVKNFSDLNKIINNLDTEIVNIEANNRNHEEVVSPELKEERAQTEAIRESNETLRDIRTYMAAMATGNTEALKDIKDKSNDTIDKVNSKSNMRRAKRLYNIDDTTLSKLGVNIEDLSENARNAIESNSPEIAKAIQKGKITNSQELEKAVSSGVRGKQLNLLKKIKKLGYIVDNDSLDYLASINPEYAKKILDVLSNKHVKSILIDYASQIKPLTSEDFTAIYNNRASDIINKFKLIDSIKPANNDRNSLRSLYDKCNTISAVHSMSVSAINSIAKFKDPSKSLKNKIGNGISIVREGASSVYNSINSGINKAESFIGDTVRDKTGIGNNGLGTFLLNGAKSIGGGIKKLFGGEEEGDSNGIGGKAAGMISSLLASKMGGDDDDHEMSGNNMVREDGNSMKMKKDSDGSLVPDTTDSNTKKTLNLIAAKEKAQEKLNKIQEAAMTKINEVFDSNDSGQKKDNKLGKILAAALGGYALIKSGALQKLYEGLIKPVWTENIKPWIDNTAAPWVKEKLTNFKDWIINEGLPKVGEAAGDIISVALNALVEAMPAVKDIVGGVLDALANGGGDRGSGAGTKTETSVNSLNDDVIFYTKNGKKVSKDEMMNYAESDQELYNKNGDKITINADGNVTVKDGSMHGIDYLRKIGKGAVNTIKNNITGNKIGSKLLHGAHNAFTALTKSKKGPLKGLRKVVGYAGKAFTAPVTAVDDLGKTIVKYGGVKNAIGNKIKGLFDNKSSKLVDKAAKLSDNKILNKILGEERIDKITTKQLEKAYKFEDMGKGFMDKIGAKELVEETTENVTKKGAKKGLFTSIKNGKLKEFASNAFNESTLVKTISNVKDIAGGIKNRNLGDVINSKLNNATDEIAASTDNVIDVAKNTKAGKFINNVFNKVKNSKVGEVAGKAKDGIKGLADKIKNTKAGKKASKFKNMIDDALKNISKGVDEIFSNNKVIAKLEDLAKFMGIEPSDIPKWAEKFKGKIKNLFTKTVKEASEEGLEKAAKSGAKGIVGKLAFWAFLIADFVIGCDQAESILGVEETDIGEEVACGISNALCNFLVVPSIIPGVPTVTKLILDLLGVDLDERIKQAEAETEKYKKETGENVTTEERLKQQKSFTGSLWNKIKTGAKNAGNSIKSVFTKDKSSSSGTGTSKYGTSKFGMAKQIDPMIAGMRFNAPGDTTYQTIGDSGCGPAAAVTAIESAYGRSANTLNAAQYALKNGYKEKNGGTKPGFFSDYFKQNGLGSSTSSNKSYLENSIRSGNPTVLMGQDKGGVNRNNPFGKNPHYVTATGVDGRGNVIIQDPESKYNNQIYKMSDVMNKTSLGVSAHGKNGVFKYGRSKYGRSTDVPSQVWGFLKNNGFSDEAAAGIMANLKAESGLDPTSIQNGGKGPAAGICQWENYSKKTDRWKNLYNYCKKQGKDWTDLECQLNFMLSELDSCLKTYSGSGFPKYPYSQYPTTQVGWAEKMDLNKYKALTNVNDAVKIFSQCFERAGIPHMDRRLQYGAEFLKQFAGKTGTAISSDSSSSSSGDAVGGFAGLLSDALNNSKIGQALSMFTGSLTGSSSDSSSSSTSGGTAGSDAQSVIQIAANEVGTKEDPMGSNSIKYNDWYYGKKVSGSAYPWCAAYVSWVGDKAGIDKTIIPKDAYTVTMYNTITKNKGKAVDRKDGRAGDIMFVTDNGSPSGIRHTGFVEDVSNNEIHTIEGNSSNQVIRRTYDVNNTKILLARPGYENQSGGSDNTSSGNYAKVDDPDNYSALGTGYDKPISKYGMYKESIKGTRRIDNSIKPKKIRAKALNGDTGIIEDTNPNTMAKEAAQYSRYGMAANANNYTKLIETVIEVLFTIADNTDKLNTIVSILNEKLGVDISKEANDKTDKTTMKRKLKNALNSRTQANDYTNSESIDSIIKTMSALAAE